MFTWIEKLRNYFAVVSCCLQESMKRMRRMNTRFRLMLAFIILTLCNLVIRSKCATSLSSACTAMGQSAYIDGVCFKVNTELLPYNTAVERCKEMGFDTLATVETHEEMSALSSLVSGYTEGSYIDVVFKNGYLRQKDSKNKINSYWLSQPAGASAAYTVVTPDGKWESVTGGAHQSICELRYSSTALDCIGLFGGIYAFGKCYHLLDSQVEWGSANSYCKSSGFDSLVRVESRSELDFISTAFTAGGAVWTDAFNPSGPSLSGLSYSDGSTPVYTIPNNLIGQSSGTGTCYLSVLPYTKVGLGPNTSKRGVCEKVYSKSCAQVGGYLIADKCITRKTAISDPSTHTCETMAAPTTLAEYHFFAALFGDVQTVWVDLQLTNSTWEHSSREVSYINWGPYANQSGVEDITFEPYSRQLNSLEPSTTENYPYACEEYYMCNWHWGFYKETCSGHGLCLETDNCYCDEGFEGLDCEIRTRNATSLKSIAGMPPTMTNETEALVEGLFGTNQIYSPVQVALSPSCPDSLYILQENEILLHLDLQSSNLTRVLDGLTVFELSEDCKYIVGLSGTDVKKIHIDTGVSETIFSPSTTLSSIVRGEDVSVFYFTEGNSIKALYNDTTTKTIAGSTVAGFSEGSGDTAKFDGPKGLVYDKNRHRLLVADSNNGCVRAVDLSSNTVSSLTRCTTSLTEPGTKSSQIAGVAGQPKSLAIDCQSGKLFISQNEIGHKLRMLSGDGRGKLTILGSDSAGYSEGPLELVNFQMISSLVYDNQRHVLYIADKQNHLVFKLAFACPNGYSGSDCTTPVCFGLEATHIGVCNGRGTCTAPNTCECNTESGQNTNACNRFVYPTQVHTIGGMLPHTTPGNSTGEFGTHQLDSPVVAIESPDSDDILILDSADRVAKLSIHGELTNYLSVPEPKAIVFAGSKTYIGGPGYISFVDQQNSTVVTVASLSNTVYSFAVDPDDENLIYFVAGHRVKRIDTKAYLVTDFAGTVQGYLDESVGYCQFNNPTSLVFDHNKDLLVASTGSHVIQKIDMVLGTTTLVAGIPNQPGCGDGDALSTNLVSPTSLVKDPINIGFIYFVSGVTIKKLTPNGQVANVVGACSAKRRSGGDLFKDGPSNSVNFMAISSFTFTEAGDILVADNQSHTVRKVTRLCSENWGGDLCLTPSCFGRLATDPKVCSGAGVCNAPNSCVCTVGTHPNCLPHTKQVYDVGTVAGVSVGSIGTMGHGSIEPRYNYLYFPEVDSHKIRKLNLKTYEVTTIAGVSIGFKDGDISEARFTSPNHVLALEEGELLLVAQKYAVRAIRPYQQNVETIVGGLTEGTDDGIGSQASLGDVRYIIQNTDTTFYLLDLGSDGISRIRLLDIKRRYLVTIMKYLGEYETGFLLRNSMIVGDRNSSGIIIDLLTSSISDTLATAPITSLTPNLDSVTMYYVDEGPDIFYMTYFALENKVLTMKNSLSTSTQGGLLSNARFSKLSQIIVNPETWDLYVFDIVGSLIRKLSMGCPAGWGGDFCNIPMCFGLLATSDTVCSGRGSCVAPNKCQCKDRKYNRACAIVKQPMNAVKVLENENMEKVIIDNKGRLWAASMELNQVNCYSDVTGTSLVKSISVTDPRGMEFSADYETLYVACNNRICAISVTSFTSTNYIGFGAAASSDGFSFTAYLLSPRKIIRSPLDANLFYFIEQKSVRRFHAVTKEVCTIAKRTAAASDTNLLSYTFEDISDITFDRETNNLLVVDGVKNKAVSIDIYSGATSVISFDGQMNKVAAVVELPGSPNLFLFADGQNSKMVLHDDSKFGSFISTTMGTSEGYFRDAPLANISISAQLVATDDYVISADPYYSSSIWKINLACPDGLAGDKCDIEGCYGFVEGDPLACNSNGNCTDKVCECFDGYSGLYCQQFKCDNLYWYEFGVCSGNGECTDVETCSCDEGYFGTYCNISSCFGVLSNDTMQCSSFGNCTEPDTCECNEGYSGENCQLTSCFGLDSTSETVCSSHGSCDRFDTCNCTEGYIGEDCAIEPVTLCNGTSSENDTVCNGHGRCIANDTCSCDDGYDGTFCDTEIFYCFSKDFRSASVCSGHGECVASDSCSCSAGYLGPECQLYRCFGIMNINSTYVCSGRGSCIASDVCNCTEDFTGERCEISSCFGLLGNDSSVCSSHGQCTELDTCSCLTYYTGSSCDMYNCFGVANTNTSFVCGGKGNCTDIDKCECLNGYSGVNCQIPTCFGFLSNETLVCNSHGQCLNIDKCICDLGYIGESCNTTNTTDNNPNVVVPSTICNGTNANDSFVCNGHGACIANETCNCTSLYAGKYCEEQIITCFGTPNGSLSVCSGHGLCSSVDTCVCDAMYKGSNCSATISICFGLNETDPNVCSGRGACTDTDTCQCLNNTAGASCELQMCFGYLSNNSLVCSSHGQCLNIDYCNCDIGHIGDTCNTTNTTRNDNPKMDIVIVCNGTNANSSIVCNGHGACIANETCNCTSLHKGQYCEHEIIFCFGIPNDSLSVCNGHGLCSSVDTCVCDALHQGADCSETKSVCSGLVETDPNVCSSHGECTTTGICNCTYGYNGPNCDMYNCFGVANTNTSFVCGGKGNCTDIDRCECLNGYSGDTCQITRCFGFLSNETIVCNSHGQCLDIDKCICDVGYIGESCNTTNTTDNNPSTICNGTHANDSSVCNGHGACIANETCNCAYLHKGQYCEYEIIFCFGIPNDSLSVCNGHGQCSSVDTCVCDTLYKGSNCSERKSICFGLNETDPNVCSGSGLCVNDNCECHSGYSGSNCEIAPFSCYGINSTSTTVCSGKGICNAADKCSCFAGYSGPTCGVYNCFNVNSTDASVCSGRGICISPNLCQCLNNSIGISCEIPNCFGKLSNAIDVCNAHGQCNDTDSCNCVQGYTGKNCSEPTCFGLLPTDAFVCNGHGECTAVDQCDCLQSDSAGHWTGTKCTQCSTGYTGTFCTEKFCDAQTVCNGHGTCKDLQCTCAQSVSTGYWAAPYCQNCETNYYGKQCDIFCNESQTCSGHGTCTTVGTCNCYSDAGSGHFKGSNCSSCQDNWYGTRCLNKAEQFRFSDNMDRVFGYLYREDRILSNSAERIISCTSLLSPDSLLSVGGSAVCRWTNESSAEFEILLATDSQLAANDSLQFNLTDSIGYLTVIVQPPLNPLQPIAIIKSASNVGSCSDIILDGSLSSDTYRRKLTYIWSCTNCKRTSPVSVYLSSANTILTVIPSNITAFGNYTFSLVVKNQLGRLSEPYFVSVTKQDSIIATLYIKGPTIQYTRANIFFSLEARVIIPDCFYTNGTVSYSWRQIEGPTVTPQATNQYLQFDAGTFVVQGSETRYQFEAKLIPQANPKATSTATVVVIVVAQPLVCAIRGGNRKVSTGSTLTLDASDSYDPDYEKSVPEKYSWSCRRTDNGGDCKLNLEGRLTLMQNTNIVTLPQDSLAPGMYTFSLVYSKGSRNASASVNIEATAKFFLSVGIDLPPIVPSVTNIIRATSPITDRAEYQWTLTSFNLNISSSTIESGVDRNVFIIRPYVLQEGQLYSVRVDVVDYIDGVQVTGTATVLFEPLTAPLLGRFEVSPEEAIAFTPMVLACSQFSDKYLPLQYWFGYYDEVNNVFVPLHSSPTTDNVLITSLVPPGTGANSSMLFTVKVTNAKGVSMEASKRSIVRWVPPPQGIPVYVQETSEKVVKEVRTSLDIETLTNYAVSIQSLLDSKGSQYDELATMVQEKMITFVEKLVSDNPLPETEQSLYYLALLANTMTRKPTLVSNVTHIAVSDIMNGVTKKLAGSYSLSTVPLLANTISNIFEYLDLQPDQQTDSYKGNDKILQTTVDSIMANLIPGIDPVILSSATFSGRIEREEARRLRNTVIRVDGMNANITTNITLPEFEQNLFGSTQVLFEGYQSVGLKAIIGPNPFKNLKASENVTTPVLSLSFVREDGTTYSITNLTNPLIFELPIPEGLDLSIANLNESEAGFRPVCKYWDERYRAWNSTGCSMVSATQYSVKCACIHTTKFSSVFEYALPKFNVLTRQDFRNIAKLNKDNMITAIIMAVLAGVYIILVIIINFVKHVLWEFNITQPLRKQYDSEEEENPIPATPKTPVSPSATTSTGLSATPLTPNSPTATPNSPHSNTELKKKKKGPLRKLIRKFAEESIYLEVFFTNSKRSHFNATRKLTVVYVAIIVNLAWNAFTYGNDSENETQWIVSGVISALFTQPFEVFFTVVFLWTGPAPEKIFYRLLCTTLQKVSPHHQELLSTADPVYSPDIVYTPTDDNQSVTNITPETPRGSKLEKDLRRTLFHKKKYALDKGDSALEKLGHWITDLVAKLTWQTFAILLLTTILYFGALIGILLLIPINFKWFKLNHQVFVGVAGGVLYFVLLELLYLKTRLKKFLDGEIENWRAPLLAYLLPAILAAVSLIYTAAMIPVVIVVTPPRKKPTWFVRNMVILSGLATLFVSCIIWMIAISLPISQEMLNKIRRKKTQNANEEQKLSSFSRMMNTVYLYLRYSKFWFPWWFVGLFYLLAWGICGAGSYVLVLYGIKFEADKRAPKWILSSVFGVGQDVIVKPILSFIAKTILLVAVIKFLELMFFARLIAKKKRNQKNDDEEEVEIDDQKPKPTPTDTAPVIPPRGRQYTIKFTDSGSGTNQSNKTNQNKSNQKQNKSSKQTKDEEDDQESIELDIIDVDIGIDYGDDDDKSSESDTQSSNSNGSKVFGKVANTLRVEINSARSVFSDVYGNTPDVTSPTTSEAKLLPTPIENDE